MNTLFNITINIKNITHLKDYLQSFKFLNLSIIESELRLPKGRINKSQLITGYKKNIIYIRLYFMFLKNIKIFLKNKNT